MKNEKNKIAIGIYIDGLQVKVAECHLIKSTFIIKSLKEFSLSEPLNLSNEIDLNLSSLSNISSDNNNYKFAEPKESDLVLDDIEDFMGINDDDIFTTKDKKEDETEQAKPEEIVEIAPQYDLSSSKFFEASHIFSQLPLKEAQVSFITSEDKLFWNYLPYSSKPLSKNSLKKQTLSKEQKKDPLVQFDVLFNKNNTGYSLVYEGVHDTFTLMEKIQPILSIRNIKYQHTEPLEIALINAVLCNYRFPEEDYVLILYLSKDNKTAIILQDNNLLKSFPLIIQSTDRDIIREAIISKIMLEQDISAINITQNIIIAGEYSTKDDLIYFKENFKSTNIDSFRFNTEKAFPNAVKIETDTYVNDSQIPKFVPSISLCYKSFFPKCKNTYSINLLPQIVIDKQKIFKLNWHGFIVLACVFGSTIWVTYSTMQSSIELKKVVSENQEYQFNINQKKAFQNILLQFTSQLDSFENSRKKVTEIIKNKNQWAFIFNKITAFSNAHAYFWVKEIKGQEDKINIKGVSYNKNNISAFSYLFPNGNIRKVNLAKIENEVIWEYEVDFDYPDPALYNPLFNEIKIEVDTTSISKPKNIEKRTAEVKAVEIKQVTSVEKAPIQTKDKAPKAKTIQPLSKVNTVKSVKTENKLEKKQIKVTEKINKVQEKKISTVKDLSVEQRKAIQEVKKESVAQKGQRSSSKYTQARIMVQKANYREAIQIFNEFLKEQPRHRLVPMANFLIAESYFLSEDYTPAVEYYQKVISLRRKKVPESLNNIVKCYRKLGDEAKANEYLEILAKKYPRTRLGKEAKSYLDSLKGVDHAE